MNDTPDPLNDLFCSDRCHDGEYDGPYAAIGRGTQQRVWPTYPDENTLYSAQFNEMDNTHNMITNNRIMTEECDTDGANACCDAMCKIITDPAGCTCTHFYIGIWH